MIYKCRKCNHGVDIDGVPMLWICPVCGEYNYPLPFLCITKQNR